MSKIIKSPEGIIPGVKKEDLYIFLAGPIQGVHDWQTNDIPDLGEEVTLINPRRARHPDPSFDWNKQVAWETIGLRVSDAIIFWVPPEEEKIEGRDYAQTTKIELTENLVRGKKIFLGIDPSIHTRRYLVEKAKSYGLKKIHDNLEDLISEVRTWINDERKTKKRYFTSDTHFGSQRTLDLSRRPFKSTLEMDWKMVELWNQTVRPWDEVYHLGDFGDRSWLKFLNGEIKLVQGNYEKDEVKAHWEESKFIETLEGIGFDHVYKADKIPHIMIDEYHIHLVHEPTNLKTLVDYEMQSPVWESLGKDHRFALFGHIHGRQMIKKYGLDVGVDCSKFKPVSEEDIKFYLNAIEKGYYDENVWM